MVCREIQNIRTVTPLSRSFVPPEEGPAAFQLYGVKKSRGTTTHGTDNMI